MTHSGIQEVRLKFSAKIRKPEQPFAQQNAVSKQILTKFIILPLSWKWKKYNLHHWKAEKESYWKMSKFFIVAWF